MTPTAIEDDGVVTQAGVAKVTICHIPPGNPANAHTITVGEPSVAAHVAHGDTIGPCSGSPELTAHLVVIMHVINDDGGYAEAGDFTITVSGVTVVGGNAFPGAEAPGTTLTLSSVGAYGVGEAGPANYATSYSADCSGTIALGETKTCTVTNDDVQS